MARVRVDIIGHARIKYVGKYQSCMVEMADSSHTHRTHLATACHLGRRPGELPCPEGVEKALHKADEPHLEDSIDGIDQSKFKKRTLCRWGGGGVPRQQVAVADSEPCERTNEQLRGEVGRKVLD